MSAVVDKLLVVGLGLIGGSLARALRASGFAAQISGYGYRVDSLRKGLEQGVIDSYSLDLEQALHDVDIVVISTPTLTAADLLRQILPRVSADTVVSDVASVKGPLVQAAQDIPGLAAGTAGAPNFVPAHPVAGSEQSGIEASRADLFVGHRVIVTPTAQTDADALALVRAMWQATGAEVVQLGVAEHDAILAATSHLPHMLAYTLVDALARSDLNADLFRFAAGGLRDFTRIAASDPIMWRDIALANRVALLDAIDNFSAQLGGLREALAAADGERLQRLFSAARTAREAFAATADSG